MPAKILEARPGRTQVFFQLLQDASLLVMGPTAILQVVRFETSNTLKHAIMAAIAIYGEAAIVALVHFVEAIRFWHLWRERTLPRSYTRRLRGISLPDFIVPLRDTSNNVQIIPRWKYARTAVIATLLACVIAVPSIMYAHRSFYNDAEGTLIAISLFLLITIGTGGNILAGLIFLLERLDNEGVIRIRTGHVRVVLPVLYSCWLLFQSVVVITRIRVHSSSNPSFRALARVYLLPVTVDVVVSTKEKLSGRIDEGKIYINLRRDYDGTATVSIENERETQEAALVQISKIC